MNSIGNHEAYRKKIEGLEVGGEKKQKRGQRDLKCAGGNSPS